MPKKVYTWGKVRAGDIVSFRYKGKKPTGMLTTLLVMNPRMPYINWPYYMRISRIYDLWK